MPCVVCGNGCGTAFNLFQGPVSAAMIIIFLGRSSSNLYAFNCSPFCRALDKQAYTYIQLYLLQRNVRRSYRIIFEFRYSMNVIEWGGAERTHIDSSKDYLFMHAMPVYHIEGMKLLDYIVYSISVRWMSPWVDM